jgi:exosome complex exonuclease RRP6
MARAPSQEDAETSFSPSTSFGAYQALLQKAALTATKQAYLLPIDTDMAFHRTLDKKFAADVDVVSARVFALTNKLLKFAHGVNVSIGSGKGKAVIREEEDLLEGYHTSVVDVMDQLYEAAVCLLVFQG